MTAETSSGKSIKYHCCGSSLKKSWTLENDNCGGHECMGKTSMLIISKDAYRMALSYFGSDRIGSDRIGSDDQFMIR